MDGLGWLAAAGRNMLEERGCVMDTLVEAADALSKVRREQSMLRSMLAPSTSIQSDYTVIAIDLLEPYSDQT